jgi:hypothetical protein
MLALQGVCGGPRQGEPIPLSTAREVQAKISAHLLSPDFLLRVDKVVDQFGATAGAPPRGPI